MSLQDEHFRAKKQENSEASSAVETFVIPQYFLRSKFCGTLVYSEPMTYEEAEKERDDMNKQAVETELKEVQYEIIEA